MKKKPFFSVVIPTLNEEKFLPRLLTCLTGQIFEDFEVIIADGGSEDKTLRVAESYEHSFQKKRQRFVLIKTPRRNVSYQRNQGAVAGTGQYYVFLDADVQIPPDYLYLIDQAIGRDRLLFITTWVNADSDDPQDMAMALFCNFAFEAASIVKFDFVPGFNVIVDRTLFWKVDGFEEKVVHAEDHHFSQKLKKIGYELTILKEPRLTFSLRRFRKEGRLAVLRKYVKSTLHILFKGPIMKEIYTYEMGGKPYRSISPRHRRMRIDQSLKQWRKKLIQYASEIEKVIDGE